MKHCCERIDHQVNYQCDIHENKYDCPDVLISYNDKFSEYGLIIHDGGASSIEIKFCPFCGSKLPESRRTEWFETLEKLGFDDPGDQDIPNEFRTGEWYRK